MSFDYPQQPRRRKGGFGGIMMLLMIGAALFFFMNMGRGGGQPGGEVERRVERKIDPRIDRELKEADLYRRQREEVLGSKAQKEAPGKAMPTGGAVGSSDWSMEEVGSKGATKPSPTSKKTQGKDGWSIEEVDTKAGTNSGAELRLKGAGGEVDLKEKSDWSLEDVKPKNKKTTEGDWTVEEVEGGGK